MYGKQTGVNLLGKRYRVRWWIFRTPCSLRDDGKWPFALRFYRWGIAFHYRDIADAHFRIE